MATFTATVNDNFIAPLFVGYYRGCCERYPSPPPITGILCGYSRASTIAPGLTNEKARYW